MNASAATLVIGYGSPIRGDDALGPLVAERLQRDGVPSGVEVIARHILTADLVADLQGRWRVIFVDAAVDSAPGEVRCRPVAPFPESVSSMAHSMEPGELLTWCRILHGSAPEAFLVSGGVASTNYANYGLTQTAQQALEQMLDEIHRLIAVPGM